MKREALAILSSGTLLPHREYGNPTFLDPAGADLSRANDGEVPLLAVHNPDEMIGHVRNAWRSAGLLKATLRFENTLEGRIAFERLESGEVRGVSIGTGVIDPNDIKVVDARGHEHAFDEHEWRQYWQDPSLILHIKRWRLVEVSITPRPLDRGAVAYPINDEARRVRRRMEVLQRQALEHDGDDLVVRRELIRYGDGLRVRMPPKYQVDPPQGR